MSLVPTDTGSLVAGVEIDHEAVLRSLNINIRDPKHQAMLLICQKYDLAPELKHAVIISGNPYITRDGLLHVAHQSGLLNGIVIESQGENAEEWTARVTVYVKGQDHGYSYPGRYSKKGQQRQYGPEMAIKCAEVHALRRAFGVTGLPVVEEQWDKADAIAAPSRLTPVEAGPPLATPAHMARIDELLPHVPQEAMPTLKAWKAEQGITMKAGEFTADMADEVIAKLEELAESLPAASHPTASAGAGSGNDKGTDDGTLTGVGVSPAVPEVSGGGDAGTPPAGVASPGVSAPDREAPSAPQEVEPAATHGEVGTAPAGGVSPPPGGDDAKPAKTPREKKLARHAILSQEIWGDDAKMMRHRLVAIVTEGKAAADCTDAELDDVIDEMVAIKAGRAELFRRATGDWEIRTVRPRTGGK